MIVVVIFHIKYSITYYLKYCTRTLNIITVSYPFDDLYLNRCASFCLSIGKCISIIYICIINNVFLFLGCCMLCVSTNTDTAQNHCHHQHKPRKCNPCIHDVKPNSWKVKLNSLHLFANVLCVYHQCILKSAVLCNYVKCILFQKFKYSKSIIYLFLEFQYFP